jgi:hypothetical protein
LNGVISASRSDREPMAADDPIRRTAHSASHSVAAGRPIHSDDQNAIRSAAVAGGSNSVGNFPTE